MIDFYKPEDFEGLPAITAAGYARFTNEKLNAALGPKVFGKLYTDDKNHSVFSTIPMAYGIPDVHSAYLFGVQEIKKECIHGRYVEWNKTHEKYMCTSCGKFLVPNWSEDK